MTILCYKTIISQAEQICLKRGVRLTSQRATVLRILAEHNTSISAYNLLDILRIVEPKAKPTTIYRALSFLLKQGFIHRIVSNNSYMICHNFEKPFHVSLILVCHCCSDVNETNVPGIQKYINILANKSNFLLRNCIIEAHGLCKKCN